MNNDNLGFHFKAQEMLIVKHSAGICSNTQETTSIGVNPQLSPPPSSTVWSPLFWIGVGVGVGLSALFSMVATRLKKYAMQQAFVDVSSEETVQKSPFESVKDDESSSVEEARVPEKDNSSARKLKREVRCSNCNNMLNTQQSNERSSRRSINNECGQLMMMYDSKVFINQQANANTKDSFNNNGNGDQDFTSAHINNAVPAIRNKQSSPPAPAIDAVSTNPKQYHTSSKTGVGRINSVVPQSPLATAVPPCSKSIVGAVPAYRSRGRSPSPRRRLVYRRR